LLTAGTNWIDFNAKTGAEVKTELSEKESCGRETHMQDMPLVAQEHQLQWGNLPTRRLPLLPAAEKS